jgi:FAD/FMN-containing dehydrogenase
LGFIVEARIKLTRQPREPRVMVLGVPDLDGIMAIFGAFQRRLELNAFECLSDRCLKHVLRSGLQKPFATDTAHYVLIEFDNLSSDTLDTALAIYQECADRGWLVDGVISESETQVRELWRLREDITESIARYQPYKNDVSVPVTAVAAFLRDIDQLFASEYPDFEVLCFGHVGDGNLHINVLKPESWNKSDFIARCHSVNQHLFETIQRHGGSISAEHGVGLTKKPYLGYTRAAVEIEYMRALKQVFDPNGIINPGKIFD